MSTLTTNYKFIEPAVNNPIDGNIWGGQLNTNTTSLDVYLLDANTGNIGTSAPTIPGLSAPTAGMTWINNTSGAGGTWNIQLYDGTNWVTTGMLNTANHTYTNVGSLAVNVQTFTTAGSFTYTPTQGMSYCIVEIVGGGGGGGGLSYTAGAAGASGGGGGGQYTRQIFNTGQIGASQPIVIGAGGAATANGGISTFGSGLIELSVAGGGGAPDKASTATGVVGAIGGIGGTSVGFLGFLTVQGNQGGNGLALGQGSVSYAFGGAGGTSFFGGGGKGYSTITSGDQGSGLISVTPGAGGGGAAGLVVAGGGAAGGPGASGAVIITEFI